VQFLGVGRLRSLVLSLHVFSCFDESKLGGFSIEQVWTHSISTGAVAQKIARQEKLDRATTDEIFVASVLHDIGKVMLASSMPERYCEAVRLRDAGQHTMVQAEREIFGASHCEVGAYLLGLWGLPGSIVEAIALHHEPERSGLQVFSPLSVVHAANVLEKDISSPGNQPNREKLNTEYLKAVGKSDRLADWEDGAREALAPKS
jgi:putative nucleotidyltransferase with HDIG domain